MSEAKEVLISYLDWDEWGNPVDKVRKEKITEDYIALGGNFFSNHDTDLGDGQLYLGKRIDVRRED